MGRGGGLGFHVLRWAEGSISSVNISKESSNEVISRALGAGSWALGVPGIVGEGSATVALRSPPGTIPRPKSENWNILWLRVKQGGEQRNQGRSDWFLGNKERR